MDTILRMTIPTSGRSDLLEVREGDRYEAMPGESAPTSTHDIRLVRRKGVKNKGRFFSKRSASDLQTFNEYLTWLIYKAAGMRVAPQVELVMSDDLNHLRLVQGTVSGRQVKGHSMDPIDILKKSNITRGLFVDAFLGNWDVIGSAPQFNLFVGKGGKVSRIDTGGMDFRAQGQRKPEGRFGDVVDELAAWTGLTGPGRKSGKAYRLFSKMNEAEFRKAAKVFKRLSWSKVDQAMRDGLARIEFLADKYGQDKMLKDAKQYGGSMLPKLKKRHSYLETVIRDLGL